MSRIEGERRVVVARLPPNRLGMRQRLNHRRFHSTLGYLAPVQFKQRWSAASARTRRPAQRLMAGAPHYASSSDRESLTLSALFYHLTAGEH